ncbi:hypothetical protein EDC01DRAFT_641917 [Geopyxis carbonaria]|nr:hypothetical protein EDC01DRAFT_641917 [Geopyxis carbonaria]
MLSWLGLSSKSRDRDDDDDDETQPLLPQHSSAETQLQATVYDKLHTYTMVRALASGYLPSTAQATAHLRTLLATDMLHPSNTALTPSGRKLVRDVRTMIHAAITLLQNKAGGDQLQEFLWCTSRARAGFDGGELVGAVSNGVGAAAGAGAGAMTGYDAVRTVADLLMTNAEFRRMCGDLATVGRQVLAETAGAGAQVAASVGETVRPSEGELAAVGSTIPVEAEGEGPEVEGDTAAEVAEVLVEGVEDTVGVAIETAAKELNEDGRGDALLERMKRAVLRLRGRTDYTESVTIISILLKRYAQAYSRSVAAAADGVGSAFETNSELDMAVKRFWELLTSFGDTAEWYELTTRWNALLSHFTADQEFEALMAEVGNTLTDVLTDPSFADADALQAKLGDLRALAGGIGTSGDARSDLDLLLLQAQSVFTSVLSDPDIAALVTSGRAVFANLWPTPYTLNPDLASDLTHVLLPLLLSTLQYIPLLRVTIAAPEVDLLLENLILEPGDTVNHSSFFPHQVSLHTSADFALSKSRLHARYTSSTETTATLSARGLTVRAEDVGYWLRAHTGVWRFWDEGLVSLALDKRGIDISLDLSFSRTSLEHLITLHDVDVKIHTLDYKLTRSRFRWLAWPFKPLLRRILKRVLRAQLEAQIAEACHALNRELVFARERLRATRVAQPKGVWRFVRALCARWTAPVESDVEVGLGVRSGKGELDVFEGRYAPGSVVKLWEEQAERVGEVVDVYAEGAWRNECFDLLAV